MEKNENAKKEELEFYTDDVQIASKDASVPSWLKCVYIILPIFGLFALFYYINGSRGWLDRGYWHQLQEAALTTFPTETLESLRQSPPISRCKFVKGFSLEIDWQAFQLLLPFCLCCLLCFLLQKHFTFPELRISSLKLFEGRDFSWRQRFCRLPYQLLWFSALLFALALVDPEIFFERPSPQNITSEEENLAVRGIALYLILDQSGSMKEKVSAINSEGFAIATTKMDLLKKVTRSFIAGNPELSLSGRPNDLIGLVTFARSAHIAVPLTLDHKTVLQELSTLDTVPNREEDGTAIGYAIFKTAHLIVATQNYARDLIGKGKPAYEIEHSVMVLVTDGLQDPNPLDNGKLWRQMGPVEAATYAKDHNIRLYIINVEPNLATEKFSANLNQMRRAAKMTGGDFFMVDNQKNLLQIYSAINQLEKSAIPMAQDLQKKLEKNLSKKQLPNLYLAYPLYPYLIAIGMGCFALSTLLETTLLKKFP